MVCADGFHLTGQLQNIKDPGTGKCDQYATFTNMPLCYLEFTVLHNAIAYVHAPYGQRYVHN